MTPFRNRSTPVPLRLSRLIGDSNKQLSKVTPLEHTHECSRCVLETVNDVLSLKNRSVFQPGADLSLEIWKQLGVIINDEPTYGQTFRKNLPDRCRDPIRPRGNRRTELRD